MRQECRNTDVGLSLDYTCMNVAPEFFERMAPRIARALADMISLETGAIANPDERRMVGHYWLRTPELAPDATIRAEIEHARRAVARFVADVHAGMIKPPGADRFSRVLIVGIGGSALGPQFVADALGHPHHDRLKPCFFDNTDPDGMARVIAELGEKLAETLCVVISKSGGTSETRNGMLFAERAYAAAGLSFAAHAVAITSADSHLDRHAVARQWRARFPMWDWVGGRTSVTSAVGLLPAALQGLDVDELLRGAAACDAATRGGDARSNPALLMALLWHWASDGRGARDMVMLPYKDRLLLLSRYLQQLIMESIGKRHDLAGREVDQGLTVYGNKGSTDQHAYVQQLRDGLDNFFVTFIRVLHTGDSDFVVEPAVTAGDYLHGFLLGTRSALAERGRRSMTLSVPRVDPFHVGVLIALFERAVGFYASLIGINAYHQPGVEAGKKAAAVVLDVQKKLSEALSTTPRPAAELAKQIAAEDGVVLDLLEHLAANGRAVRTSANGEDRFSINPE